MKLVCAMCEIVCIIHIYQVINDKHQKKKTKKPQKTNKQTNKAVSTANYTSNVELDFIFNSAPLHEHACRKRRLHRIEVAKARPRVTVRVKIMKISVCSKTVALEPI